MQIIKNGALVFTGFKFKGTGFGANASARKLVPQWANLDEDDCGCMVLVFRDTVPEQTLQDLASCGLTADMLQIVTLSAT